ncbi:MAG: hypothetical protein WA130_18180 [Candidatus Methanoperedens sp.]
MILFLSLNAFWILPIVTTEDTLIQNIGTNDLSIFAPRTLDFNTIFTIATMHGFWRGGYISIKEVIPYWYLIYIFILFLSVHGAISYYKEKNTGDIVKGFIVLAVIGVIFGAGIGSNLELLNNFLKDNIFSRGFRDSQKFVALLALSYSFLGGLGVYEFEKQIKDKQKINLVPLVVVLLALISPFLYSVVMFNGFWGLWDKIIR